MTESLDQATNDKSTISAAEPRAASVLQPEVQDSGRNAVFAALVKGDTDITGLVAYSIFKQNELDWLSEFKKARDRDPTEAESESYIIGESTPRRLATYRHLADATLAGRGPDVANGGAPVSGAAAFRPAESKPSGGGASTMLYVVIAILVLLGVYFAARYGVPK